MSTSSRPAPSPALAREMANAIRMLRLDPATGRWRKG